MLEIIQAYEREPIASLPNYNAQALENELAKAHAWFRGLYAKPEARLPS